MTINSPSTDYCRQQVLYYLELVNDPNFSPIYVWGAVVYWANKAKRIAKIAKEQSE